MDRNSVVILLSSNGTLVVLLIRSECVIRGENALATDVINLQQKWCLRVWKIVWNVLLSHSRTINLASSVSKSLPKGNKWFWLQQCKIKLGAVGVSCLHVLTDWLIAICQSNRRQLNNGWRAVYDIVIVTKVNILVFDIYLISDLWDEELQQMHLLWMQEKGWPIHVVIQFCFDWCLSLLSSTVWVWTLSTVDKGQNVCVCVCVYVCVCACTCVHVCHS